jgi:hypothetical protein
MSRYFRKIVSAILCLVCAAPSALWAATDVSTTPTVSVEPSPVASPIPAPKSQVSLLNRLYSFDVFSVLKQFSEIKKPVDSDVTDALMALYPEAAKGNAATWGKAGVSTTDVQGLLELVRQKKGALRAHGLSAWTFEKKLEKIEAALSGETMVVPTQTATSTPSSTPTPRPTGPDEAEFKALRDRVKTLESQEDRLQSETALRVKAAEDAEKARSADRDAQREEARLLKNLVDELEAGQKRLETALAVVDKKATEKGIDDEELQQSLSLMRKDLRDNVQDVSVLKQKVEKLMAPEKTYARPFDKALASKWVPGAAVLIAIGALVIAASKK